MLLRNRKTQGDEKNWCLILSPLKNEIDKKKVAHKISEAFTLSQEEAIDLVANTPIILLDNLTRPMAVKLKDYFASSSGAEMILTNDIFQKRKCYRTIWPEPPSLSFLHNWNPLQALQEESEILRPDEALNEIRSLTKEEPKSVPMLHETLDLRKENELLREECSRLQETIEQLAQREVVSGKSEEAERSLREQEREIRELRVLLSSAEERYGVLKEEYRESRNIYEEKLSQQMREAEQWNKKAADTAHSLESIQKIRLEHEKSERILKQSLNEASEELERHQIQVKQLIEKIDLLEKAKESLEHAMNEQADQVSFWSEKNRQLTEKQEFAEKRLLEEKALREKAELRVKDLEKSQIRLIEEVEAKSREAKSWEIKYLQHQTEARQWQEAVENHEKILQANYRQLEMREKELENARRQLREMNSQLEQREAVQKRTRLASELAEKEMALKRLVQDQEKIESEIREREESIRKILSDQEKIERDIIESKQAQRHLSEQLKKNPLNSKVKAVRDSEEMSGEMELPAND